VSMTSAGPEQGRLRVVIAEDAVLLREGLRRVLGDAGLDVVGVAGDGAELLRLVQAVRPEVVLADIRMPPSQTTEGLEAALEIRRRWPGTAVIVLSQHVETEHLFELLAWDPRGIGYVLKERVADIAQFTGAIRRVAAGESVIDQAAEDHRRVLAVLTYLRR
jgi:DNA-binding NarL/FixJ family response regulator